MNKRIKKKIDKRQGHKNYAYRLWFDGKQKVSDKKYKRWYQGICYTTAFYSSDYFVQKHKFELHKMGYSKEEIKKILGE